MARVRCQWCLRECSPGELLRDRDPRTGAEVLRCPTCGRAEHLVELAHCSGCDSCGEGR